jgi:hypothetical protein
MTPGNRISKKACLAGTYSLSFRRFSFLASHPLGSKIPFVMALDLPEKDRSGNFSKTPGMDSHPHDYNELCVCDFCL